MRESREDKAASVGEGGMELGSGLRGRDLFAWKFWAEMDIDRVRAICRSNGVGNDIGIRGGMMYRRYKGCIGGELGRRNI